MGTIEAMRVAGGLRRRLAHGSLGSSGLLGPLSQTRFATRVLFGKDSRRLLRGWHAAGEAWADGHYDRSVSLRTQLLLEADEIWSADDEAIRLLSPEWISNMGHLGWLAAYIESLAHFQPRSRCAIVFGKPGNQRILREIADGELTLHLGPLAPLLDLPPMWSRTVRLSTVRTPRGYEDMNRVWQRLYGALATSPTRILTSGEVPPLAREVTAIKGDDCRSGLQARPYALWLNRQSPTQTDPRFSPELAWLPSVEYVKSLGLDVIRIGDSQPEMGLPDSTIDMTLQSAANASGSRDLELLRGASFLMTSNSGPVTVAAALRVPILQVNTIAVSRNLICSPAPMLSLPKHHWKNGRKLVASQIFGSALGYMERGNGTNGITLTPNSADEILQGVRDLVKLLGDWGAGAQGVEQAMAPLEGIRGESGTVSRGSVAPSFLEQNPSWVR